MKREDLMAIAQQATFLAERSTDQWVPAQGATQQAAAQSRLERWCQLAAGGDWTQFTERLAWDALDLAQARRLLTDGQRADWREPPAWTALLAEAVAQCEAVAVHDPAALMNPFVSVAQAHLQQAVGAQWLWLTPAVQAKLIDDLRQQLVDLAAPTLTYTPLLIWGQDAAAPAQRGAPALATLCRAYPVLARQLVTNVMQWVDSCAEFLARLAADWPLLVEQIGQDTTLAAGSITDLRPGLSDPHAGGRTVWAVTIATPLVSAHGATTTLAYKPKALTMDCAWNDLIRWCNDQGLSPQLGHLWTLPRAGYGWMAWATPQPTAAADHPLYAQRVGMVLGLLHLLHATDCHAENLVTQGDQLLLVDAEMLRYPQIAGQRHADPLDVLRTGLLPRWRVQRQGIEVIGGLVTEKKTGDPKVDPCAVATGYTQMLRFLAANWAELKGSDGPLAAFQQGTVRVAPRPTAAYLRLLDQLRHPAFLQRGVDFSLGVDQLARTYLKQPAHRPFWPLLAAEQAALCQGDVPYFTVPIDQSDWVIGAHRIAALHWPPFALPTPYEEAQQQRFIQESLADAAYLPTDDRADSFLALALHLGELLRQRAVPLAEGGLGWIAHQFQPRSALYQPGLIGDDLYSGRAGIALFLAALYRATGDDKWRTAALAALHTEKGRDGTTEATLGGQCYALSHAAGLLAAPALTLTALAVGQGQEFTAPTEPLTAWGVVDGLAGQILGLLALHQQSPTGAAAGGILPQAVACGDALLAGQAAWAEPAHGLGGFAHGAAGIAYALTQLYRASGAARFLTAAAQGWASQQALYRDPPSQWQDRRGATPVYLANWCNGAAGIGLAAAGSVPVMPQLATVVERAATVLLTTTATAPLDTLCCGRFGQIDSFLEMGVLLQRSTWIDQAAELARTALPAATAMGYFRLYDELPPHLFNPTFFRGVAGIGYTLLRLAALTGESKVTLPCVLRWALEG